MRAAWAVFFVSMAVYLRTLHPSIAGGDSAEFVNCSYNLTVGHPPGYPLFLLVTALASRALLAVLQPALKLISVAEVEFAWAANFISAVFSAAANAMLAETVLVLMGSRGNDGGKKQDDESVSGARESGDRGAALAAWLSAVAAGLLFGFSPLVWRYSIHAEVFSLNNLLASILLHALVKYCASSTSAERLSWSLRGALVCGLGASNQHTLSLMAIPIAAFSVARGLATDGWRARELLRLSARFLAGLSCYVYLIVVDMPKPIHSWGDMGSFTGIFSHFIRADYGSLSLAPEGGQIAKLGSTYTMWYAIGVHLADFTWKQTPLVTGPAMAIIGARAMLRGSRLQRLAVKWIVALALIYLLVFNSLANLPLNSDLHAGIMARFYMQPNILAFALLGAGIDAFLRALMAASEPSLPAAPASSPPPPTPSATSISRAVLAVTLLCGWQLTRSFHEMDQSGNYVIKAFGLGHLALLPENAILLTSGDVEYGSIRYAQDVLGFRTDVAFMETTLALKPWYRPDPRIKVPGVRKPNGKYSKKRKGVLGKDYGMAHLLVMNHKPEEGSFVYISGGSRPQPTLERVLEDPSLRNGRWEGFPFGFTDVIVDTRDGQLPIDEALEDLYKSARTALPGLDGLLDRDTIVLPLLGISLEKYKSDSWEYMVAQRVAQCYHRLSWMLLFYADVRGYRHDGAILKASREAIEPLLARDRLPFPVSSYMYTNYLRLIKDPGFDALARDHVIESIEGMVAWSTELERREKEAGRWDGLSEPEQN